jgi:hypothetical protein
MKRDMNLVRQIVLSIEASPSGFAPRELAVEGYSHEEIGYHLFIMLEAGLIRGADVTVHGANSPEAIATSLTWAGHEFADAARNEDLWAQAMKLTREKAGGVTIDLLMKLLTSLASSALGL